MSDSMKMFSWYTVSGVLLGVPFVVPALWVCGLIGVAVFVYATTIAKAPGAVLLGGFVAWMVKSLFALSFGWSIWPIESFLFTLPLSGFWVIAMYWISGSVFLGTGGAFVAGWLWYTWTHKKYETLALLTLPALWLLGEFLAARLFSVLTIGPDGFYTAAFSYGQLGYILAEHNLLILLAKLGGVYVLTVIAAMIGVMFWYGYKNLAPTKRNLAGMGAVIVLIVSGFVPVSTGEVVGAGLKIAVVDTEFNNQIIRSLDEITQREVLLGEAIDVAITQGVTHIILPEGSRFNDAQQSAGALARRLRFLTADATVVLVDSGRAELNAVDTALRATVYDGVTKEAWQVDKQYLVPQGEYVPVYFGELFKLVGMGDRVAEVGKVFDFVPGPLRDQSVLPAGMPRILFCHSSADPVAIRRLLADGTDVPFIAHPISHAWFGGSQVLKDQQTAMLRIQALWNDIAIVSAGNKTRGELYAKNGEVRIPVEVGSGEGWTVSVIDL